MARKSRLKDRDTWKSTDSGLPVPGTGVLVKTLFLHRHPPSQPREARGLFKPEREGSALEDTETPPSREQPTSAASPCRGCAPPRELRHNRPEQAAAQGRRFPSTEKPQALCQACLALG